jgi:serine/threonine protein kinase
MSRLTPDEGETTQTYHPQPPSAAAPERGGEKAAGSRSPERRNDRHAAGDVVGARQTLALLVQHREALGLAPTKAGGPDGAGPVKSTPFIPRSRRPSSSLLDDRTALRAHGLEPLGPLDAVGGMGAVALAWHSGIKREVVLKSAQVPYLVERFRREIELHARLGGHEHIVVARHAFEYDHSPVLMIDYVPGPSLKRYVGVTGPLPWREATECVRQAALGLRHAHAEGIIHRDIKPSNLVRNRRDGVVSVIDWGLALDLTASDHGDQRLSVAGLGLGTPEYCAPEQTRDASAATPASDLYGLGCTWYELLTGELPFPVPRADQAAAHASSPVPRLPDDLRVPPAIDQIVRRLLEKSPEARYQSADDLLADLEWALTDTKAPRPSTRTDGITVPRRALLATAGLAAVGVAWLCWHRGTGARPTVLELSIELSDTSDDPKRSGKLGETTYEAREGDQVTLYARLSAPAYAYLISFRPDGDLDVWSPAKGSTRPEAASTLRYPARDSRLAIDLDQGVGLQVFALVASRQVLPSFDSWRAEQGPPPWRASIPVERGIVWRYDGDRIETQKAGGPGGTRGEGTRSRKARGAVDDLVEWLKGRPGIDAVYLKAFGVQPSQSHEEG